MKLPPSIEEEYLHIVDRLRDLHNKCPYWVDSSQIIEAIARLDDALGDEVPGSWDTSDGSCGWSNYDDIGDDS